MGASWDMEDETIATKSHPQKNTDGKRSSGFKAKQSWFPSQAVQAAKGFCDP